MAEPYTCSTALIDALLAMGTERVYGIVGTSNVAFLAALSEVRDRIRYVSCRHEQVAGSMADAEGRLTGKPGVVLTHSGPGTFNALISLGNAYKDCSPVICITGAVKRKLRGSDGMLEADHLRIFAPICKAAYRVEDPAQLVSIFGKAYHAAMSGARGPVLIEVPEDLWTAEAQPAEVKLTAEHRPPLHVELVWRVLDMLKDSERPLLLAGGGVTYSRSSERLVRLAERVQVPVATTGNGRGAMPERHPLSLGRVGFGGGNSVADAALERADLVIGLGCTISDMTTYEYTAPVQAEVVLVNVDLEAMLGSKFRASLMVEGDVAEWLDLALHGTEELKAAAREDWFAELDQARSAWSEMVQAALAADREPLSPARLVHELGRRAPEDTIVTVGAGLHLLYPMDFWPLDRPGCFLSAVNFGAMGFGFPAALGAKLVYPERQVVAIQGDGDFMMTVQDLETAVRERIGVKVVILNDGMYRVLDVRQRLQFAGRIYGTRHGNPDFVKLAEAFGAEGLRVERPSEVDAAVERILAAPGPLVAEVVIDPDDLPPMNLQANLRMSMG
jgi:acetolactate synthase-1/2/3 large subunit